MLFRVNVPMLRNVLLRGGAAKNFPPSRLLVSAVAAGFAGLLALEVYGFLSARLTSQAIWYDDGLKRFLFFAKGFAAVAAILCIAGWRRFAIPFAAMILVLTVLATSPMAVIALLFFLISCCALGSLLFGFAQAGLIESQLQCTLAGSAVYVFLMTWVARLPVNYAALWVIVLAIPIAIDVRGVWRRLRSWIRLPAELDSISARFGCALLLFVLCAHWMVALKPEAGADALAMHLAIPMDIAAHHRMSFDPSRFVWAVMPMGADWCYSITYLVGGEAAARLFNFSMLLAIAGLLYSVLRRWVTQAAGFLLVALFAATPLVQLVTGSLFVENFLAALILGTMAALWRFSESGDKKYFYLAALLGGTAMAVKFGATAFIAPVILFLALEARRHWTKLARPWLLCASAAAIFLIAALPAYAIAYHKTSNPLFPFLNQKFPSPLLDPSFDFQDARFRKLGDWRTLYDLTFSTSEYYEGQNGSLGFQYLLLIPLGLFGLFRAERRIAASAAGVGLGAAILILRTEPNARYLYAALPLVLIPFAALLGWLKDRQFALYRVLIFYLTACLAFDIYFLPASGFQDKNFSARVPFAPGRWNLRLEEASPVRRVIAEYNRIHGDSAVLFTHEDLIAGTDGEIYENLWHQAANQQQIRQAQGPADLIRLFDRWHVRYFIAQKPGTSIELDVPALEQVLASCTAPVFEFQRYYLARLDPDCRAAARTEPPLILPQGSYDGRDPALLFKGNWTHGRNSARSAHPDASVAIAFYGRALTYHFRTAPDGGLAEISVDGAPAATLDLYGAQPVLQHAKFCCFTLDRHIGILRVTGRKRPESQGAAVNLEMFQVSQAP